jgi:hypothetical protein
MPTPHKPLTTRRRFVTSARRSRSWFPKDSAFGKIFELSILLQLRYAVAEFSVCKNRGLNDCRMQKQKTK